MNDLEDVAMTALDAMESADAANAGESDDANPSGQNDPGDDGASSTNDNPDNGEQGEESQTDDGDGSDGGDKAGENGDKSSETEQKPNENGEKTAKNDEKDDKPAKKELTDEEFEEMARKRGYFKQQPQQQQQRQPLELSRPKELDEQTWGNMPEINRIIYKQLPTISVRGTSGDETEPRVYTIKTPAQLPDDFKFASDKEKTLFDDAIATQSRRADTLEQRINQYYAQQAQQEQASMVVEAIDRLQENGIIPKIVAKNGTPEFDKDPGVVAANSILAFWKQRNEQGANMSIDDAAVIYKATHPDEFKVTPPTPKGDAERKNVAGKIGGGRKSADNATNKKGYQRKYWRPGMSTEEVAEMAMEDLD